MNCKVCGAFTTSETGLCADCFEEIRKEAMYKCPVLTQRSDDRFMAGGDGSVYLSDLKNLAWFPK